MCRKTNSALDSWAAWVQDGRPQGGNPYPNRSSLQLWNEANVHGERGSRPLYHGKLKKYWLVHVDQAVRSLSEDKQLLLLGVHLPGKDSYPVRAAELGYSRMQVQYARKLAKRAIEAVG